jgi:hypothetical protein
MIKQSTIFEPSIATNSDGVVVVDWESFSLLPVVGMAKAVTVTVEIARPKVTLAETYNGMLRKKYARDTKH